MAKLRLTGTDKEKAKQLVDASKTMTFTKEELKEIVPLNSTFIKEFCGLLKDLVADARESHKEALLVINNCITVLQSIVADDKVSIFEKMKVLPLIKDATDKVYDMHKRHERSGNCKFFTVLGAFVGLTLAYIFGNKSNNNGKMKA